MALDNQSKKGGRYSKKEQEERRLQVYQYYFEQAKSAVKIAKLLNVNRNTINDDIRYLHKQIGTRINPDDIVSKMAKQILRIEIQRDRLLEILDDAESLHERIKLERFIAEIDNRLLGIYLKINNENKSNIWIKPEIDEKEIIELVRTMTLYEGKERQDTFSENEIKIFIVIQTRCDITYANNVFNKMVQLGLELVALSWNRDINSNSSNFPVQYNLDKFAVIRGYAKRDEIETARSKSYENKEKEDQKMTELLD